MYVMKSMHSIHNLRPDFNDPVQGFEFSKEWLHMD